MGIFGFIKFLQEYSNDNLIIVEGKKDKEVLAQLELKNVYALYEISKINIKNYREVLILIDNDKKGRKTYHRIVKYFESEDMRVNHVLRKKFFKCFPNIVKIEELKKWARHWQNTWKELEQFAQIKL